VGAHNATLPPRHTPETNSSAQNRLRKSIDRTWQELDIEELGVLDKIQAHRFVSKVLREVKGEGNFGISDFDRWFDEEDKDGVQTLDKSTLLDYVYRKVKESYFGH
jgi:hypothetical protein